MKNDEMLFSGRQINFTMFINAYNQLKPPFRGAPVGGPMKFFGFFGIFILLCYDYLCGGFLWFVSGPFVGPQNIPPWKSVKGVGGFCIGDLIR
jgi:hypothetical protein